MTALFSPRRVRCHWFVFLIWGLVMTTLLSVGSRTSQALPQITTFTLANGMDVVVIPDHRAPVVTHMVWYRVGAADEPLGKSGLAHFLEHLMFKGTEKIGPSEFSKIIARNGGQDNAFTTHDTTVYHQRVAKDRLALVMEMEADRMRNLRLLEKDVVTERDVILEERRSRVDNDPSAILHEQILATLYLAHPYGRPVIGWEKEVAGLTREDALAFYRRFYAPNNALLVVAGDVTPDEVRRLAEKTYGRLPASPDVAKRKRPEEPEPQAARRVILKDPRAGEATLQRYYLAPAYGHAERGEAEALDLMMKILAAGTTSRLYQTLVVEKKVASSAGGWYSGTALDSGRLAFYAVAADGVSLETVEREMDKVIASFRETGPTERELTLARNAYIASYVYANDNQARLARRYGWALITGQTVEDVQRWPERLETITRDQVQRVAKTYLQLKRSVTGLLIPIPEKTAKTQTTPANDGKS